MKMSQKKNVIAKITPEHIVRKVGNAMVLVLN